MMVMIDGVPAPVFLHVTWHNLLPPPFTDIGPLSPLPNPTVPDKFSVTQVFAWQEKVYSKAEIAAAQVGLARRG